MKYRAIFIILFLCAVATFLIHFFLVGKAIYGDGRYYYSYLPAFLIQHTLDLSSAFLHTDIPSWRVTPVHLPANIYPIGPAVFWTIPYLFSFGISFLLGHPDPFAVWFQIPIGIFAIFLTIGGLWILFLTLQHFFSSRTSLLTVVTIFFTTNLLFYGAIDVLNSHSLIFFLSCLFIFFWLKKSSLRNAFFLGIVYGLLMLVRPQEAIFGVLIAARIFAKKEKIYTTSFFIAALVFVPQLLVWYSQWGSIFVNPYLHVATFNFLKPQLIGVLFNTQSGFFLWTPITALATIGLFLFAKKEKRIATPLLLVYFIEIYVIASWSIWWEGQSYSARMLISCLPFLALGIGYFYEKIQRGKITYSLSTFFGILNCILIIFFLLQT